MLELLSKLVTMESPTREKLAVDRLGKFIVGELQNLGINVTLDHQQNFGDHVLAHLRSNDSEPGFLTLCHIDTVFPLGTIIKQPCIGREDRMHGPGALDMKAGTVILLTCVRRMLTEGRFPESGLTMLFTTDEETGSHSSRPLIERLARRASLVLCMEPGMPDGSLKTWRKGVGSFEIIVRGKAAHAGSDHEKGCNAIEELAHHIVAIRKLTDYQKKTTLSVGVIEGGTVTNVIPDFARAKIDIRVMDSTEGERVTKYIRGLTPVIDGCTIEVRGGLNRPPMPYDQCMAETFQKAQVIAAQAGIQLRAGGSGGGSDANFVATLGVPVLDGLGAIGNGMHSPDEYILVDSLPERAALLYSLLLNW